MNVIVCLDKDNGMMFNKRRQSRDRIVIEDIMKSCNSKKLWMNKYSAEMFNEYLKGISEGDYINYNILVDDEFVLKVSDEDYCFVEDLDLKDYNITVGKIVIYRWDKKYPADMYFNIEFEGYDCKCREELKGFSHEKIIKEVFVLKNEFN